LGTGAFIMGNKEAIITKGLPLDYWENMLFWNKL
jgi:hypothetical protein